MMYYTICFLNYYMMYFMMYYIMYDNILCKIKRNQRTNIHIHIIICYVVSDMTYYTMCYHILYYV